MAWPCLIIFFNTYKGMRLPARETEVLSGTKNPFQFNFLGTDVIAYHVLFGATEFGKNIVCCKSYQFVATLLYC
jgi:hypothetical protein